MRSQILCLASLLAVSRSATVPNTRDVDALEARKDGNNCLPVWNTISADLAQLFTAGSGKQCNDNARAAIRLVFHDCGTWNTTQGLTGGCDGSLVNTDEINRGENGGLATIAGIIRDKADFYKVSRADLIVFAGSEST